MLQLAASLHEACTLAPALACKAAPLVTQPSLAAVDCSASKFGSAATHRMLKKTVLQA